LHNRLISEIEIACKSLLKWEKHNCKIQESIAELFDCEITTNYFVNKQWSNFVTKRTVERHLRWWYSHGRFYKAHIYFSGIMSGNTGHNKHKW